MRVVVLILMLFVTRVYARDIDALADTVPPQKSITVVQRPTSNAKPAQNIVLNTSDRYVGFNTSYLLQQLMPFNAIPLQQNMYGITYRKYRNNKGYRLSAGVNLSELDEIQWLGFRVDKDKRKVINSHWLYFYGGGGGLEIFQDPDNNVFFVETEVNLLGQLHWGIEYKINSVMSLSMECQGTLKLGSSSSLVLRPPTVITAHFNLN